LASYYVQLPGRGVGATIITRRNGPGVHWTFFPGVFCTRCFPPFFFRQRSWCLEGKRAGHRGVFLSRLRQAWGGGEKQHPGRASKAGPKHGTSRFPDRSGGDKQVVTGDMTAGPGHVFKTSVERPCPGRGPGGFRRSTMGGLRLARVRINIPPGWSIHGTAERPDKPRNLGRSVGGIGSVPPFWCSVAP